MTNLFLKVNKDLFKLGLNPTEILVLAQIMEFNTNTGDCFMSDKAFAEAFGVSESTISRELKVLEKKGFITRTTKNIKGGKERHITINAEKIEQELTIVNLTVDEDIQESNCLLSNVNLPVVNRQIDFIKDNSIEIKEEDNIKGLISPNGESNPLTKQIPKVSKKWLEDNKVDYRMVSETQAEIVATKKIVKLTI